MWCSAKRELGFDLDERVELGARGGIVAQKVEDQADVRYEGARPRLEILCAPGLGESLTKPALKCAVVREPHSALRVVRLRIERATVHALAAPPVASALDT